MKRFPDRAGAGVYGAAGGTSFLQQRSGRYARALAVQSGFSFNHAHLPLIIVTWSYEFGIKVRDTC